MKALPCHRYMDSLPFVAPLGTLSYKSRRIICGFYIFTDNKNLPAVESLQKIEGLNLRSLPSGKPGPDVVGDLAPSTVTIIMWILENGKPKFYLEI